MIQKIEKNLISEALKSEKGQEKLIEEIRNQMKISLINKGVGKKLLYAEKELIYSAPMYDLDTDSLFYEKNKKNNFFEKLFNNKIKEDWNRWEKNHPYCVLQGNDRAIAKPFEKEFNLHICFSKTNMVETFNTEIQKIESKIISVEDKFIFSIIDIASTDEKNPVIFYDLITIDIIKLAINKIREHGLNVTKIVVNSEMYSCINDLIKNNFRSIIIIVSEYVPINTFYVMADSEFVGVIPMYVDDILIYNPNSILDSCINYNIVKKIGGIILNSKSIVKIEHY